MKELKCLTKKNLIKILQVKKPEVIKMYLEYLNYSRNIDMPHSIPDSKDTVLTYGNKLKVLKYIETFDNPYVIKYMSKNIFKGG